MTDEAYLFLLDDATAALGVAPSAVGDLACMDTPAVQAWLDAQGIPAASPRLRLLPPEERGAVPEGAERLPVPLSDDELSRVRHGLAPASLAQVEEELLAYRDRTDDRDGLIARALAAGVPPHRVAELTGVDPATVTAAARQRPDLPSGRARAGSPPPGDLGTRGARPSGSNRPTHVHPGTPL